MSYGKSERKHETLSGVLGATIFKAFVTRMIHFRSDNYNSGNGTTVMMLIVYLKVFKILNLDVKKIYIYMNILCHLSVKSFLLCVSFYVLIFHSFNERSKKYHVYIMSFIDFMKVCLKN